MTKHRMTKHSSTRTRSPVIESQPGVEDAGRVRTGERGDFLAYYLVMVVGVLLTIGFMVDAGRLLAARRELNDVASQAAIAAGQHPEGASVAQGGTALGADAIRAGQAYLASVAVTGTISITAEGVVVETSGTFSPIMFGGFSTRTIEGLSTARLARGVNAAEN